MKEGDDISPQRLHEALLANEFFLEYMPTVALQDRMRCVGSEALIRWRRSSEVIYPAAFIAKAENTPVSGLMTYWVIDSVARELGDWLRKYRSAHVGINVPPEVLGRGGLEYASEKARLLDVRKQIVLEITERGIPDQLGLDELENMADENILIAMDDVNVDESNFIVLSRLPVPIIKLDRAFVAQLNPADSSDRLKAVSAFIRLGRHYVIAEGVETPEQARLLREAGVQYAQGWLFSKSMSAANFIAYYAARQ